MRNEFEQRIHAILKEDMSLYPYIEELLWDEKPIEEIEYRCEKIQYFQLFFSIMLFFGMISIVPIVLLIKNHNIGFTVWSIIFSICFVMILVKRELLERHFENTELERIVAKN